MNAILQLTGVLLVSAIISFSCSKSQQIACPDYGDNTKLKHKTAQAYKPQKYKPPKTTRSRRVKFKKFNPSKTHLVTAERSTIEVGHVEERSIKSPSLAKVIESIYTTSIESQSTYVKNDIDFNPERYGYSPENESYVDEIKKYRVTAQNNVAYNPITTEFQAEEVVNEEASDVIKSPVPTVTSRKSKRQALRNFRRSINNFIEAEPGGEAKPVTGFAVAALVLGIVSFFFIPFIAGPLAIIFGGVALKRAESNPDKEGRGLAIAGLVLGIVGTLGGLIILLI